MNVEVKDLNNTTKKLTIKLEPAELQQLEKKVINRLKKSVDLPGFRRGRVPESIIRSRYADTIRVEIMEEALSKYYWPALDEAKIQPITEGKITNINFENIQSGMEIEIDVEVEPEIELKKYKGLKVEKEIPVVTDEMVEGALKNLQERYATATPADIVEEGYDVTVDLQLLGEGDVPVVGKKYENIPLKIGSGQFDKELEEQLIGLKVGEKTIFRRTIETPDQEEKTPPQVESYEVVIKSIEKKEYPPLDDEFVKNLGEEGLETMEDLRKRLHDDLLAELQRRSEQQFHERLIDELLKENPFDVPETMIEHYLEHIVEDIKKSTPPHEKVDEKLIRQHYRAHAIYNIRWYLAKKKLAELENIDVSMEEIHQEIDKLNIPDDQKKQAKENNRIIDRFHDELLERKILAFLAEHAEIIEISPSDVSPGVDAKKDATKTADERLNEAESQSSKKKR